MKYRIILSVLIAATVVLGYLAWRTAHHRGFDVVFGVSDEEAIEWVEKAKHDRWVEIVTLEFADGEMTYQAVPNKDIDEHIRTSDRGILIRRWLPNKEASGMLGGLASHGYPGLGPMADEISASATSQQRKTYWLIAATVVTALASIGYGLLTPRFNTAKQTFAQADDQGASIAAEDHVESS